MEPSGRGSDGRSVRLKRKAEADAFQVSDGMFKPVHFELEKIRLKSTKSGVSAKKMAIGVVKSDFQSRGMERMPTLDSVQFMDHFNKYNPQKPVFSSQDKFGRPSSVFGFPQIGNNGRGDNGTPDPMGTRLESDDRSHGFPVSQLFNPDHGNKQPFMVAENWLGNQGLTQGIEQLMSTMPKPGKKGPKVAKFRQLEYGDDHPQSRPTKIHDTILKRSNSGNHLDMYSISHDNANISRSHN